MTFPDGGNHGKEDRPPWDDAMLVKRLRQLCSMGRSFSEMAKTLTIEFKIKITRSAAIGKCKRLGIGNGNNRGSRGKSDGEPATPKRRAVRSGVRGRPPKSDSGVTRTPNPLGNKISEIRNPKETNETPREFNSEEETDGLALAIEELSSDMCRWPLGDFYARPPYSYCGLPTGGGRYCARHAEESRRKY